MSQYLLLIYENEKALESMDQEAFNQIMKGHQVFGETYGKAIVHGEALQPTGTATTVRQDAKGSQSVTDGPFPETKEALGGFYLVEAADLDKAIEMAKLIPTLPGGGVEVRPIRVFD